MLIAPVRSVPAAPGGSDMANSGRTSTLLSLVTGAMLLWLCGPTRSVLSSPHIVNSGSVSPGQREELPRVAKRSIQSCNSSFDDYCLNNGQCMLLVDINEHHCKCDLGFHGSRCAEMAFVFRPMGETQITVIVFCAFLLMTGLAGAAYFLWKRYKKIFSSQQKRSGAGAAQTV